MNEFMVMHQELKERKWDVFICHASEDKEDFVRPLAHFLSDRGLSVAVESKMGLDFVAAAILNVAKPIISGVSLPNSPSPQIGRLDLLRDQPKTPKPHSQS